MAGQAMWGCDMCFEIQTTIKCENNLIQWSEMTKT